MTEAIRPDPDPTRATVDFVDREMRAIRALFDARIDAIEKAATVFADNLNRVPTTLDREIGKTRDLTDIRFQAVDHRFGNVQLQFIERDQRINMEKGSSTHSVNAALDAQKALSQQGQEANAAAVAKQEANTTKQIDGILLVLAGNKTALDDKIASINSRLDRGDGGNGQKQAGFTANTAVILLVLTGLGLLLSMTNTLRSVFAAQDATQHQLTIPTAPQSNK